ncbi:MAG TPA: TfoX/Sxy family protein [Allosphingosinicella sp.]|jgi:DNA transformation protein
MSVDQGLIAWAEDALEPLGPVTMRRMMGAATLYLGGTVFAIQDEGEIWFKADAESDALWDAQGCARFTFDMGEGRIGTMNYRRAPPDVYDDAEAMQRWAALALEAGMRAAAKKKPKGSRKSRSKKDPSPRT